MKNLSDDPTLTQLKPAGGSSGDGVVASVLRLLPPPSEEKLGAGPASKKAQEETKAPVDEDVETEGTAAGSYVRGHGRALNPYPTNWRGVIALPVATVNQEGVDTAPVGLADWEKIVDLEGVPKPLPPRVVEKPSEDESKGPASGGAAEAARVSLPGSLQHQAFQSQKSPRSILPPIDAMDDSPHPHHPPVSPIKSAPPAEPEYSGIGAGKRVRGVSPGLREPRRNGAEIAPGKGGKFTHSKPTLPRVSHSSQGKRSGGVRG